MVTAPAKKEEHPKGEAKGKTPEQKKVELVPVEKLLDALQEEIVTTITEVPKHMEVYGEAKPKIEEVLNESVKMEELLRNLPRKKPTGPGTKVKPNQEKINELSTAITNFSQYAQEMRRQGEMFGNAFAEIKELKDKVDKASALAQNMRTQIPTIKKVNGAVQAMLKDEQYGFVKEPLQNEFETALVYFLVELISFTSIIYDTLRYAAKTEEEKKAAAGTQKETLEQLKAIADACEKSIELFRTKKEAILEQVKDAKELKALLEKEEKAELEELKRLQQKAEPMIAAIKKEMNDLLSEIHDEEKEFEALTSLEQIEVKQFDELHETLDTIEKSIPDFLRLYQQREEINRIPPSSSPDKTKERTENIRKIEAAIEAKKVDVKKYLTTLKAGIGTEKTLGTKQALRLNTILKTGARIINIAENAKRSLGLLHQFLESKDGKTTFKDHDEVHNATTEAIASLNNLQDIIHEELEERNMFGTIGRIMKQREEEEKELQQELDKFKSDDKFFQDVEQITKYLPSEISRIRVGIEAIKNIEQAIVQKLKDSKERIDRIKKNITEAKAETAAVEKLLPEKGVWANAKNTVSNMFGF